MFDTEIQIYKIIMMFAIFCGLIVVYKNIKRLNYEKEDITCLLVYIFLGAIFGGKYFSFMTHYQEFNGLMNFSDIGFASYGGMIGVLLSIFIFSKQYKRSFKDLLYSLMPSLPLIYSVGKIACFLVGCCYGIEYNGIFSVVYNYSYRAPKGVSLFPIQLLESIVFMVIFIYFYNKMKKEKNKDKVVGQLFFAIGFFKFVLDYLRMSHVGQFISINQVISLFLIFIGLFFIYKDKRK